MSKAKPHGVFHGNNPKQHHVAPKPEHRSVEIISNQNDPDLADSLAEHDVRWAAHQRDENARRARERAAEDAEVERKRKKRFDKAMKVARKRATKKAIKRGRMTIVR